MKSSRLGRALQLLRSGWLSFQPELLCKCCGQPYYPDQVWTDKLHVAYFGAERFDVCPICTQAALDDVLADPPYRRRCVREGRKLQRMYVKETRAGI